MNTRRPTRRSRGQRRSGPAAHSAGFTLVELMVALTGGLFISLAVFALARDSGRFYQREARLANATVSGLIGFERLRADLGRAGFLASPNAVRDPRLCGSPTMNWPTSLRNLASIQLSAPTATYAALTANGRTPPVVTLAGSYTLSDVFGGKIVHPDGANTATFFLSTQEGAGALRRLGNTAMPDAATMATAFPQGRALRIVQNGKQYYAPIISTTGAPQPTVTFDANPNQVQWRSSVCGLSDIVGSGASTATINIVNFIQYAVRAPQTPTAITAYKNLFDNSAQAPGEAGRTELTRVELDLAGNVLDGSEEIVAEYAVDLNLQVIADTSLGGDPKLSLLSPGDPQFTTFTGPVFQSANTPHRIRAVRVRLGVRSRDADRKTGIPSTAKQGLFRFDIGSGTAETFARVRTFQADVALHNQADITWP
ncbi:MAG TPA: prepilin-type N-terminal cleavage/methylation domain-containing protein [Polyangiaceae bacterium]|nr:prepilin-type N-terminal cleavage/methylation domain-containing protein [Polyangiaceae bacterium]